VSVVLDAYAVIAALVGEPARKDVEPYLATGCVSAVNLGEVVDVCVRVHGNAEATVRERIDWLVAGGLEVVVLDTALAMEARRLASATLSQARLLDQSERLHSGHPRRASRSAAGNVRPASGGRSAGRRHSAASPAR
jgi:PIN domain nuclease of toxin-antitoxin system